MQLQRKKSCRNKSKLLFRLLLLLSALPLVAHAEDDTAVQPQQAEPEAAPQEIDNYVPEDEELIFETSTQGYMEEDYLYAYNQKGKVFLPFSQVSAFLGIMYDQQNKVLTAWYSNEPAHKYIIDLNTYTASDDGKPVAFSASDYKFIEGTMFFDVNFISTLFGFETKYDFYDMKISFDREREFPTMVKRNADARRQKSRGVQFADRSYKDYEKDERWIGSPVIDLQVGKNWSHNKGGKTTNSDNYAVNISTIAAGVDVNSYISGSSSDGHKPRFRFNGGRTLLDDGDTPLNLRQYKFGDITGIGSSYFTDASYGRGASFSSFKNLVLSADKTIDIVGPLAEGWEVELYWNGQLLGYRQNSINGEYNFAKIPVSYGLNTFKLVFYGPYGEVRTEEKRYYSGTSPVHKGEFGYNVAAYQPWRYLVEENEPNTYDGKDIPVLDSTFYYGATDDLTVMGGYTQTPDAETKEDTQHFGMAGFQYAIKGSSVQYNLETNLDTEKSGHHVEWQGDVYIGTVYASYDKYNSVHSPVSYSGNEYLKDKTEFRFSGSTPWALPYYVSYRTGKKESGDETYKDIVARVSKSLEGWYLSLEDTYDALNYRNVISPRVYNHWGNFSWENSLEYRSNPDPDFTDFTSKLTWREDRYTYYTAQYRRDLEEDMDYYSLSGARIFPFGGLSLTLQMDKKKNFSSYLTYNISFAKEPGHANVITSANSKLSGTGSIYVTLHDDEGNPLEGVGLTASNLVKEVYTDENGAAFLTDLSANEKTILTVDMETLEDVSLKPDAEVKKLVLRPGTLREIDISFSHYASVEGQIANPHGKRLYGYKVAAVDAEGNEVTSNFSDLEGYFIVSDVPYGTYDFIVSKDGKTLAEIKDVKVDDIEIALDDVYTKEAMRPGSGIEAGALFESDESENYLTTTNPDEEEENSAADEDNAKEDKSTSNDSFYDYWLGHNQWNMAENRDTAPVIGQTPYVGQCLREPKMVSQQIGITPINFAEVYQNNGKWLKSASRSAPAKWIDAQRLTPARWINAYRYTPALWIHADRETSARWINAYRYTPARWINAFRYAPAAWIHAYRYAPATWIQAYRYAPAAWIHAYRFAPARWINADAETKSVKRPTKA